MIKKILERVREKVTQNESIKKILYTIGIITVYKILSHIPLPLIDVSLVCRNPNESQELLQMFLGGGIERFSILSLGITPYITASILTQLLTSISTGVDFFKTLKNDRGSGVNQLNQWTKYFTLIIAISHGAYTIWNMCHMRLHGMNVVTHNTILFCVLGISIVTAGSFIAIWLSNLISKKGIGSGTNIIIFVNILSSSTESLISVVKKIYGGQLSLPFLLVLGLFIIFLFTVIVFTDRSYYRVRIYNLGSEYINTNEELKVKVNNSGIMPIIIASYLSQIPHVLEMLGRSNGILSNKFMYFLSFISHNTPWYFLLTGALIALSTVNHSEISIDPKDISYQLQENNIVVIDTDNIRPGLDTERYLRKTISHLPVVVFTILVFIGCQVFSMIFNNCLGFYFTEISATSILLAVQTARAIFSTAFTMDHASLIRRYHGPDFQAVKKNIEDSYISREFDN